ncbi:Thylakoid lumenal 15.0 kDa protein 2, chloroplastic [Vitis vinifera]|uniref:Thylakoid lumenal 15.0 kDa protein 2, chloroplastic n=1 Tax=Vitis vinifera TaxID=29760 RepID=A0A438J7R0_VITVI|nr:Thylakoid lumenal 15.0 kDa protein 2, chloroplastic [Vitis vinifera]
MAVFLRYQHLPSSSLAATASLQLSPPPFPTKRLANFGNWVTHFRSKAVNLALSSALTLGLSLTFTGVECAEAKVGVNKPDLLPKEFSSVIDVAGFLSDGQSHSLGNIYTTPVRGSVFSRMVSYQA